MARDLKLLNKPPMGMLAKPCKYCKCTWGYQDISIPARTDPVYLIKKSYTIIVICGHCGREQTNDTASNIPRT